VSIYDLCDDPDGVAVALAAGDQFKASLRDADDEQVVAIRDDPKFAGTLVVSLAQKELDLRAASPSSDGAA
jgi:hypothetical protein